MRTIEVNSFAKVNLYLEIKKKRQDGYHEIETVFQRINLVDTILIEEAPQESIEITCCHPDVPQDNSNIVYKAARLFFKEAGINKGLRIKIEKKIPVAAGLGGGSGNAAAVLTALNTMFGIGMNRVDLLKMGRKLGADVPFFVLGEKCALGHGIGEVLEPVKNIPTYWYVISYPKAQISSKWAYGQFKLNLTKKKPGATIFIRAFKSAKLEEIAPVLYNDLASVVGASYKEVQSAERALRTAGSKAVLLSGSGPCVFGICQTKREAEAVRKKASGKLRDAVFFVCRGV